MPDPVPSAQYYDAVAAQYDRELERRRHYVDAVDAIVAQEAGARRARTILDIGTGNGRRLASILARTGCAGVGIDGSPAMAAAARANGVHAEVMDVTDPAADLGRLEPAPPYDLVLALWNVLGHVGDTGARERALRTMRAAVAPAGAVIFDVNNRHNTAQYGWSQVAGHVIRDALGRGNGGDFVVTRTVEGADSGISTTVHVFSVPEVRQLCAAAGLTPRTIRFIDYETGRPARSRLGGQILVVAEPA
jgi:SAM-dependent methyltransferase